MTDEGEGKELCERCQKYIATRIWREHSDKRDVIVCDGCWHTLEDRLMHELYERKEDASA